MNKEFLPEERKEFDIKKFLFKILNEWKLIAFFVFLSTAFAVFINRYSTDVYRFKALIHLTDNNENIFNSSVNVMFKWGGASDKLQAQIAKMTSYNHLSKVVKDLNWEVTYIEEGRIKSGKKKSSDVYEVLVDKETPQWLGGPIKLVLDSTSFSILSLEEGAIGARNTFYSYLTETKSDGVIQQEAGLENLAYDSWVEWNGIRFKIKLKRKDFKFPINKAFRLVDYSSIVKQVIKRFKVAQVDDGSSLLELSYTGTEKNEIIEFLNKAIEVTIKEELIEKTRQTQNTIEFVEEQLGNVDDTLKVIERQLEFYRKENNTVDLTKEGEKVFEELALVEGTLNASKIQSKYFTYLLEFIENNDDYSLLIAPSIAGVENISLSQQIDELRKLSLELKSLSYSINEENPYYDKLKLRKEQAEKIFLSNISTMKETSDWEVQQYQSKLNLLERKLNLLPSTEQGLIVIRRKYELLENQFTFLLQKRSELGIMKASTVSQINVINKARDLGQSPISPNRRKNLVLGFAIGFILPIVIILIIDLLNTKLQSYEELRNSNHLSVLGVIPRSSYETNLPALEFPKSRISESFRGIRESLKFYLPRSKDEDPGKIVLITSTVGGEGKTFFAMNLATTMAITNKKVLLIGLDMRKPKIFSDFGLSNDIGLSNMLIGDEKIDAFMQSTKVKGLKVVTAGPIPPNPSELLSNNKLMNQLDTLKQQFDYIILDTPPVGLVTDALQFMMVSDLNIYIVRHNYSDNKVLDNIESLAREESMTDLVVAYNDFYVKKSWFNRRGGYNYGYGYGYGYGYSYGYGYGYYDENSKE